MKPKLEKILDEFEELSVDELLLVLDKLSNQLSLKLTSTHSANLITPKLKASDVFLPQETAGEIESSFNQFFTAQELAEMDKVDLSNLPTGPKSLSEMIIEDR